MPGRPCTFMQVLPVDPSQCILGYWKVLRLLPVSAVQSLWGSGTKSYSRHHVKPTPGFSATLRHPLLRTYLLTSVSLTVLMFFRYLSFYNCLDGAKK